MKVLLVTAASVPESFKALVSTLRSEVGTCEHLRLAKGMSLTAQKKLLDEQRHLMAFDRHILCYKSSDGLSARLNLFADFNDITLLSLCRETAMHRRAVLDFAKDVPWLRWAGSDRQSLSEYHDRGLDAHLLPPLISVPAWQLQKPANRPPICHVLGHPRENLGLTLPKIPGFYQSPQPNTDVLDYLSSQVSTGDVVFIQEPQYLERHLLALAMAIGSVVVVPSSMIEGEHSRSLLRGACVRVDSTAEVAAFFSQIQSNMFAELASRSLSQAQFFTPEHIAKSLARLLAQPGRSRTSYRSRTSWL